MVEQTSPLQQVNGLTLRLIVIGSGIVFLVLLMFADKTNLNTQDGSQLEANNAAMGETQASAIPAGKLPPLAPDEQLDTWIADVEKTTGAAQKTLLDSIVNRLSARRRYAYAVQYAQRGLAHDSSLNAKLQLGRLYQQASRLEYIGQDSVLFERYANQAIAYLEEVVDQNPNDEQALYYLGLAYVESKNPQNSMKGILTIRKILEINPDNVEAGFSLGMFSIQTGQFDKAVSRFEKVLRLQPENQSARYYLAYAKVQLNQSEGVGELLETVLQQATDPELKQMARNLINQIN
jgi:tetratricopeptide (TPR) repeat protein